MEDGLSLDNILDQATIDNLFTDSDTDTSDEVNNNETKDIKTVNKITLCDNGTSPIFYPTFKGILYLSGIACKRTNIHNQIIHLKKSEKQECVCDNKNGNICLTREDPCEIKLHTPEN